MHQDKSRNFCLPVYRTGQIGTGTPYQHCHACFLHQHTIFCSAFWTCTSILGLSSLHVTATSWLEIVGIQASKLLAFLQWTVWSTHFLLAIQLVHKTVRWHSLATHTTPLSLVPTHISKTLKCLISLNLLNNNKKVLNAIIFKEI